MTVFFLIIEQHYGCIMVFLTSIKLATKYPINTIK